MNRFFALATICGLAATLATPAVSQNINLSLTPPPFGQVVGTPELDVDFSIIGPGTKLALIKDQTVSGVNDFRAAAVAGTDVIQLIHVGIRANPFFVDWLDDHGGYTPEDVIGIYLDANDVIWVYVDELAEADEDTDADDDGYTPPVA